MAAELTFREELLNRYNKISFDPETDPDDLNQALADVLIQNESLRSLLKKPEKWEFLNFEHIATTLKKYGLVYREVVKVFEAYSPEAWEEIEEASKNRIIQLIDNTKEWTEDEFLVDLDIYPFQVSKVGIQKYYEYEKEGKRFEGWETITSTPIILNSIGECVDDESCKYQIKYRNVTGQIFERWVDPEVLLTSNMKELVNLGLQFMDSDQKNLKQYFKLLLGHSHSIPSEFTAYKNGWKKDNTVLITGSYAHTAAGKKEILALTEEISEAYEVKGNKKEWIENLTPLLEFDLIRLKCYATVAAMIIRFIGVRSFIVYNYYESSGLKSISMQVAASLVGNPLELIKDADSTKVGIEKILEYNTDTPIYFDETSNNKEFQDVIYMIGNEQGKNRGNKDGGIDKAGKWKTVVQTTGETPLSKGQSTNTGIQMRVIEIFEGIPRLESDYIERVKETLDLTFRRCLRNF